MPEQQDKFLPAGSIRIDTLSLITNSGQSVDLRGIVLELNIYESIEQPFIVADMILDDALGLHTDMPIVGDELVSINFQTPHKSFLKSVNLQLQVISIREYQVDRALRKAGYMLRMVSPQYMKNITTRIRQSWEAKPVDAIARDVFEQYLGGSDLIVSPTSGLRTIVIPAMSPTRALKFLSREAVSNSKKPSNFVFFQNADGFYFVTIEDIIEKDVARLRDNPSYLYGELEFLQAQEQGIDPEESTTLPPSDNAVPEDADDINDPNPENRNVKPRTGVRDKYFLTDKNEPEKSLADEQDSARNPSGASTKPYEFMKINDFRFVNLFDIEQTLISGGFSNKHSWINPSLELFENQEYNYKKDYEDFQRTRPDPGEKGYFVTENSQWMNVPSTVKEMLTFTNKGDQTQSNIQDLKWTTLHEKIASVSMLGHIVLEINIPGDSEKRAGNMISIEFPEFSGIDSMLDKYNRLISGEYLIMSVRHKYDQNYGYSCILLCVKNATRKSAEKIDDLPNINENSPTQPNSEESTINSDDS